MTTETHQMTLPQLILAKKGDRSYAKVSEDCGGIPTDRRLNSLVLRPMNAFPDVETIRGLALGLGVSVTDVLLASARSLGLAVGLGDPSTISIPGAGHLPETSQKVLGDMARELLKMQQSMGEKKPFTDYQAKLRQGFAQGARLRRVPASEIEAALQTPGWYLVKAGEDAVHITEAVLGRVSTPGARQLKASLRDVLSESANVSQDDVDLAADKGQDGIGPEDFEHDA